MATQKNKSRDVDVEGNTRVEVNRLRGIADKLKNFVAFLFSFFPTFFSIFLLRLFSFNAEA